MSDLNPELARLIKERDEARLWEKDALFDLGRLSEQLQLLARGVIRDDPKVKEIASDLLTGGRPQVLVEAQEGGRIRGWGAEFLARMFVEELERHGAENFVDWTMESVGLKVLVTIQRLDGRRPTEIIAELKAQLAAARAVASKEKSKRGKGRATREESEAAALEVSTPMLARKLGDFTMHALEWSCSDRTPQRRQDLIAYLSDIARALGLRCEVAPEGARP